ncbi:MAG: hypothetical protein ABIL58_22345 [Pseudomonadota bacterium]
MAELETGLLTASGLPAGQRTYYEQLLMENLRTKSILVPFTAYKEDFAGRDTGRITYSEVFDTEPNWKSWKFLALLQPPTMKSNPLSA